MLALEGLSVLAILVLSGVIVAKVAPTTGLPVAPFIPSAEFDGWSGIGYGLVFTILSFAGFEGAATLSEEVINPRRSIPIAIMGTVLLAGVFFVFVSYAQVIGYGLDQIEALGNTGAPLNDLAIKYVSENFLITDYFQPWMDDTKQEHVVVCVDLGDGAQQGSVSKGPQ